MIWLLTFGVLNSIEMVKNYGNFWSWVEGILHYKWPWSFEARLWAVVLWMRDVPHRFMRLNMWSLVLFVGDYRMFGAQRLAKWSMPLGVAFEDFQSFSIFSLLSLLFCYCVKCDLSASYPCHFAARPACRDRIESLWNQKPRNTHFSKLPLVTVFKNSNKKKLVQEQRTSKWFFKQSPLLMVHASYKIQVSWCPV